MYFWIIYNNINICTTNIFNGLLIFLDILRKLGFQKESIKENSIDEEEEIPEA